MSVSLVVLHIVLLSITLNGVDVYRVGIVGGKEVAPHTRPYMASLQLRGQHKCGGVLLRDDFVLTAAHCNEDFNKVVLGAHSLSVPEATKQEFDVDQYIPHPQYDGHNNDIMLLKLRGKANLTVAVQLIPLMTDPVIASSQCSTAGWGDIGDQTYPDKLQEVNAVVITQEECRNKWGSVNITKSMVCATGHQAFQGFCSGDSGGPLVCNGISAGVVSFSGRRKCADPISPDVYMQSSSYRRWIKEVLKNN